MTERHGRTLVLVWSACAVGVLTYYYAYVVRALISPDVSLAFHARGALVALVLIGAAIIGYRYAALNSLIRFCGSWLENQMHGNVLRTTFGVAGLLTVPWTILAGRLRESLADTALPLLPFAGDAAARAGIGLVGATLVWISAVAAGTLLLRALRVKMASTGEYVVFASASGFLILSFSSYALAGFGAYTPRGVGILIAATLLVAAGLAPQEPIVAERGQITRAEASSSAPWFALATAATAFGFLAALAPEKEYDALWYHLNLPRLWLDAGGPVDLIEEYVALYPLTWELVFGAGLVLGGAVGAKLLHFACLLLLGSVVWLAGRRYVPASPAAAVAFLVMTPTLLWESSTAYVDVALSFHAAAASYALARYAERDERAWAAMAALQFGAAAATKHSGVVLTLLALAAYVLWMWLWRSGVPLRAAARRALLIGGAAALIPLPWYVRSAIASGNPVFPELFAVFGASPPERWDALTERGLDGFKSRFGFGRSFSDLLRLPWDVTVHGARFGGSIGPLFLLLVPAAWFARRGRAAIVLLSAVTVGYVLVWSSPISSYQLRFLMPMIAPGALLAAAGLDTLTTAAGQWTPRARQMLIGAVFAVSIVNLPPFTRWHGRDREGWSGFLTHVLRETPIAVVLGRQSERDYLRRELPAFDAWQVINEQLPNDARVLTFVGGDHFYARRRRLSYDATIARAAVGVSRDAPPIAIAALRRLGITHVLFDRRELARIDGERLAIGSPAIQQACAVAYDDRRVWVCELDYRRLPM